jgi:hypothetical protein
MPVPVLRRVALALLFSGCAAPLWANGLQLTIKDGLVTLVADNVPVGQILDEWARIGDTTIVNGDKLVGPPVTLRFEGVPEREVLDALLRSAAGYLVAPRPEGQVGPSQYNRILILATSRPPATAPRPVGTAPPPVPFAPPPIVTDEQYDPTQVPQAEPGQPPALQPYPGPFPGVVNPQLQPGEQQPTQPVALPQPGFVPVPPQQGNPPVLIMPPGVSPPLPPRKPGGGGSGA